MNASGDDRGERRGLDEWLIELEDIRATIATVVRCGTFPADNGHLDYLRRVESYASREVRRLSAAVHP